MKITVAVATYNRPRNLICCLASLAGQRRPADEIVVVGQGEDRVAAAVAARSGACSGLRGRVRYIHLPAPSIAAAENAAVAAATGDVIAFIDDDATAPAEWLDNLAPWFDDPAVGGAGGPYVEHPGGVAAYEFGRRVGVFTWYGRYISRQWSFTPRAIPVDVLSGSNMAFRRELVPVLPAVLRPYWNAFEVYLCGMVRRQGYRIIFDPRVRVDHYRDGRARHYGFVYASDRDLRRRLYRDHAHNFVYAAAAHFQGGAWLRFLLYEFLVGDSGRPGPVRAAVLCLQGRGREAREGFGPALRGKVEGLRSRVAEVGAGRSAPRPRVLPWGFDAGVPKGALRKTT